MACDVTRHHIMSCDGEANIEVCACGFDVAQCEHKQEVGGCRQEEEDEPEPDDEPDYDRDGDHHDQMRQRLKETR